jgi:hypothetical protein
MNALDLGQPLGRVGLEHHLGLLELLGEHQELPPALGDGLVDGVEHALVAALVGLLEQLDGLGGLHAAGDLGLADLVLADNVHHLLLDGRAVAVVLHRRALDQLGLELAVLLMPRSTWWGLSLGISSSSSSDGTHHFGLAKFSRIMMRWAWYLLNSIWAERR